LTVIRIATEGSNSGKICGDSAELDVWGVLFVAGFLGEEEGGVGALAIDGWFHGFIVPMLCVGMPWGRSASSMSGGDAERLGIALPTQSVGTMRLANQTLEEFLKTKVDPQRPNGELETQTSQVSLNCLLVTLIHLCSLHELGYSAHH
jgi:hypothetical protein